MLSAFSQKSASFSHLGNTTFQNTYLNPALIPDGRIFIGIPVLSGVHFHLNNKVSYNEIFTPEATQTTLDISKIVSNLQGQNLFSAHLNVNLFHVGVRTKSGALVSFTGRERIEADFLYSKEIVDYLWNGNEKYVNEDINVDNIGVKASHFREFGIGFAAPVNEQLSVGLRGKFLIGFADISTPSNFNATLFSSGEAFQLDAQWENASLRTSGLDIYAGNSVDGQTIGLGSHLVMNGNTGVALDIGATYRLNRYYTITGSLLDVGFISWKENIVNYALNDTTFNYDGITLDEISDVRQTVEDSLLNNFETTENNDPYRAWLPLKGYGSWIYHYSKNTDIHVSAGMRLIQRQLKMMYGVGVTHRFGKIFTASVAATKLPQQFFNAGASFAVKGGPVQLYMAADQVINFSVPDAKAFDFRFGINYVIGAKKQSTESSFGTRPPIQGAKGVDTNVFLGRKVKTKKREGIYSIIKRQKRRELKQKKTRREGGVQNKSLTGRGALGSLNDSEVQGESLTGRKDLGTDKKDGVTTESVSGRKNLRSEKKTSVQKKSTTRRKKG
ncbi:MAG: DUF5723 family protein [Bacteroidota bacterium]